jgi:hypothetical protein
MQGPPIGSWRGVPGDRSGPHGGYGEERPWYLRKRMLALLVVVVVVALALASRDDAGGNRGRGAPPATTSAVEGNAATPAATEEQRPAAGQRRSARDGSLSVTVNQVRCGVRRIGQGLRARTARGQFCLVFLTVTNVGERRWALPFVGQRLVDGDGRRYGPDLRARTVVPGGEAVWKELDPGQRTAGTIVFELPAGARPVSLVLNDAPSGGSTSMDIDD